MKIVLPKKIQEQADAILEKDETVVDAVVEAWGYRKGQRWLVLTDKRVLIIVRKPMGISYDIWPLYLDSLSIDMNEGPVFDTIYLDYKDQKFAIQFFKNKRGKTLDFFREINHRIISMGKIENEDIKKTIGEIEALARVFHEKIITKEEYDKKKKELMDRL